jgi:tRNA nucleotidyltransferase/poly(A) polymerase
LDYPEILQEVQRALPATAPVWLVGGAIRDGLLRHAAHDLDFVVAGHALATARAVADALAAAFYPLDAERDVGRVVVRREGAEPWVLDFAGLRGDTLAGDLAARDFTFNAIAAPLAAPEALIDPLHGVDDLRAKRLRLCSPTAVADDPLRGVRAVRLAAKLNLHIDPSARAAIRAHAEGLAGVSAERRRDEFIRLVSGPRAATAIRALNQLGLLKHLAPELLLLKGLAQPPNRHALDVWEHTLATVAWLEELLAVLGPVHDAERAADLTLALATLKLGRYRQALNEHLDQRLDGDRPARWTLGMAALLHDIGKPATQSTDAAGAIHFYTHEDGGADLAAQRLTELRFSNEEIKRAATIIAHHMRPMHMAYTQPVAPTPVASSTSSSSTADAAPAAVSRRAVYRFFRDAGAAGVDIVLVSLADFLAHYGGNPPPANLWERRLSISAQLLSAYFENHAEVVAPPPLIAGRDLVKTLGLKPGPQFGELLEAAREAQAAGEVKDKAAALEYVKRRLQNKR